MFSIDSDKQYILNHSGQSSAFILASGQRLDDILNNWLLVVYDANWQWSSWLHDLQPLIDWRGMQLTMFDKPFMIKE